MYVDEKVQLKQQDVRYKSRMTTYFFMIGWVWRRATTLMTAMNLLQSAQDEETLEKSMKLKACVYLTLCDYDLPNIV